MIRFQIAIMRVDGSKVEFEDGIQRRLMLGTKQREHVSDEMIRRMAEVRRDQEQFGITSEYSMAVLRDRADPEATRSWEVENSDCVKQYEKLVHDMEETRENYMRER